MHQDVGTLEHRLELRPGDVDEVELEGAGTPARLAHVEPDDAGDVDSWASRLTSAWPTSPETPVTAMVSTSID